MEYARTAFPIYAIFLLIDRMYQFYRFGSFFNTYLTVFGIQQRQLDPSLPPTYPFEGKFLSGFLGPLFAPEKSIFLFDPLLILALLATTFLWRRLTPAIRAFSISAWLLLFAYIFFYARYTVWSGDFRLGRPLCLDRRADRHAPRPAGRPPLRPAKGAMAAPCSLRTLISQHRDTTRLPGLLASARDLPDAGMGQTDHCHRSAFQEHRSLCTRQDGRLGSKHHRDDPGPLGLRPHHHLEFPALPSASCWRRAVLGGRFAHGSVWLRGLAALAWLFWELRKTLRQTA